jgi:quercetin dioxygenase-like cupin family protein
MVQYRIDFQTTAWDSPAPGIRSKVYKHQGCQLRLVEFSKKFIESDWCLKGHIGYMLEGQMEIDFNGNAEVFSAGDGLFIPPGEENRHRARILTEVVKIILVERG